MRARRTFPAVSFWAMLAAVWALLVLGAAPAAPADVLCGAARHGGPGHQDCIACCPCTLSGPVQALAAAPPVLPAPRGALRAAPGIAAASDPATAPAPAFRARSPPLFA